MSIAVCCDNCTDVICEAPTVERAIVLSIDYGAQWRSAKVRCIKCRREPSNTYVRAHHPTGDV